ncbi:hypothetical protein ACJX0J_006344, partial [Zea mays]
DVFNLQELEEHLQITKSSYISRFSTGQLIKGYPSYVLVAGIPIFSIIISFKTILHVCQQLGYKLDVAIEQGDCWLGQDDIINFLLSEGMVLNSEVPNMFLKEFQIHRALALWDLSEYERENNIKVGKEITHVAISHMHPMTIESHYPLKQHNVMHNLDVKLNIMFYIVFRLDANLV